MLGATVTKAVQSRKLLDRIDVVVVDEAGMVDLPSAWYVAGLAGKRLVVAGDFRQLPAVTKGDGDRKATPGRSGACTAVDGPRCVPHRRARQRGRIGGAGRPPCSARHAVPHAPCRLRRGEHGGVPRRAAEDGAR
ncbi:AAA domain-containing protein [Streptomyces sp. NPDC001410]|uniref:AAA domain-containing protein n=1 Tax=Streptomyces sp. NPDC001410 TaxID=3364574 RepID=UPI003683AE6C